MHGISLSKASERVSEWSSFPRRKTPERKKRVVKLLVLLLLLDRLRVREGKLGGGKKNKTNERRTLMAGSDITTK